MRLRATIMIDIEADNFADAAEHQARMERIHSLIREEYEQARLDFRQRRERTRLQSRASQYLRSGRVADYDE